MNPSRRAVLGGSLVLAFAMLGGRGAGAAPGGEAAGKKKGELPGDLAHNRSLDAWLRVSADGRVTLKTGKVELGQGVLTAFAQLCADELDVELARLDVLSGDTQLCPDQGATAGSMSMPEGGLAVRHASAEARALLLTMASEQLRVPAAGLDVRDGTITDRASGKSVTYWALVGGREFAHEVTGKVVPRTLTTRRHVGQSVARRDLPGKVKGEASFVHDLRPDGMVHGRVVRAPGHGAKLLAVDTSGVESMPGVIRVVRDGDFLGVVAAREWQAIKAEAALAAAARWGEPAPLPVDPHAWLLGAPSEDKVIERTERPAGSAPAARSLGASYRKPYLMHGSIGPSCAVALWDTHTLTVDTHSQTVFETCEAIAKMLGLAREQVHGRHAQGAGCYGHNGADDAAADAALLAHALPGRPVRVQWSRADEHTSEPYGPAMEVRVRADLDAQGDVLDWHLDLWSTSHGTRPGGDPGNLLAGRTRAAAAPMPKPKNGGPPNYAADRNAIALYAFAGQTVTTHFVPAMPLRTSSTRGLGAYANVFAIESFMDELAHAASSDPINYRLRHLRDERARAVLSRAAERFGWSSFERRAGHGRGVAFARYKNLAAYCAICVEVSATDDSLRIVRAVLAADAGQVVNPDGLTNQLEGGLLQSLSWTLKEAVAHDERRILSRDWSTYPILTFTEVPPVEVVLIDRPDQPSLGAGEASQGPTAAALANALFDATGTRVRQLPLHPGHRS